MAGLAWLLTSGTVLRSFRRAPAYLLSPSPLLSSLCVLCIPRTNDRSFPALTLPNPEIPIADLPSPPTSHIPLNDASTYGGTGALGPLYGEAPVVQCEHCDKPVLASALVEHHRESLRLDSCGNGSKVLMMCSEL